MNIVAVDDCHADLIENLIKCNKSKKILELGFGSGASTDSILRGLQFNNIQFDYTLVDSWYDWQGEIQKNVIEKYQNIKFISSSEESFVKGTLEKYDFIMSDADHLNTDRWFYYVYKNLLEDGGILIYHDVNFFSKEFINLRNIFYKAKFRNLNFHLFNKNSRSEERCERGLMVIFKPISYPIDFVEILRIWVKRNTFLSKIYRHVRSVFKKLR